jgi:GH24 family phage-related lysozyme (muramidase)
MRLNVNQLKRVAQHLNTLRIEEKYRKIYLDCLDPTAKKRPGASECAKAELMIVQKLVARAPTKVAFVGLGASGKDPILVARDGSVLLSLAGKPIKDTKSHPSKRFLEVSGSSFMRDIEKREGRALHMYVDVKGNVTLGVGHKLTESDISGLRMTWRKDAPPDDRKAGQIASRQDMVEEANNLRQIKSQLQGQPAASQKPHTLLDLASGEADRLLRQDYRKTRDKAHRDFTLSSLPPDVQVGLLDLYFQRGPNLFRTGFPKMTDALERRDWKKAGQESSVNSGSGTGLKNRNSKRKAFFERAARQHPFHRSLTKKRKLLDLLLSSSSL